MIFLIRNSGFDCVALRLRGTLYQRMHLILRFLADDISKAVKTRVVAHLGRTASVRDLARSCALACNIILY